MTSVVLRFHPNEKYLLSSIKQDETGLAYKTIGKETHNGKIYDVITLSFHYNENMAIGCGWWCFPYSSKLGYHPNDIEYVSIYSLHGQVEKVYFSAHGRGQGVWKSWSDCEKTADGNLVIYVALNSHACYPSRGLYIRIFGLANDLCSGRGKSIHLSEQNLIQSYNYSFNNGVSLYKSLRPKPPDTSITSWQRFALPFYF